MRIFQILLTMVFISCATVFAQAPPPAKVLVSTIFQEDVSENRPFVGRLYYDTTSQISSEVSGLVEVVAVHEGELVKKNAPLIRLNTELLDEEINLNLIQIEQINLQINHAEKNYKRLENLFKKKGVSEKAYDDALYAYQHSLKEKQIAELELKKLLLEMEKSAIRAPYDGIIMRKHVDSGDWVQQGKQLIQLGATDDLFVKVPIAETLLQFVKTGSKVAVEIKAFNQELHGTIEAVDPVADAKTKNVFIKVRIPSQANIAENMSATVFLPISARKNLSIIPRDALIKMQGADFVYTITDDKAAILPVNIVTFLGDRIGADNPHFSEGMKVVIEGNERLRPDQPVVVDGEN